MSQAIKMPALRVGAKSHVGKVRTDNQDRMGRFPSLHGELYIVADGMGGHKGGALAAAMTIDGFAAQLMNTPPGVSPEQALQRAAQKVNFDIYQKANDDNETANMGATLVLGLVRGNQLIVGHAGDSRAYLFRDGKLSRLTYDHSVVQRMIDHKILTEEQARNHPDASIITRAFGQEPELELEITPPVDLRPGDGILLCSDGLSGYVDDSLIQQVIRRNTDAQQVTDALIDLALSAGGEDNVTIQFLQIGERSLTAIPHIPADQSEAAPQSDVYQWLQAVLIFVATVLLFLFALYMFGIFPSSTKDENSNTRDSSRGASIGNKATDRPERDSETRQSQGRQQPPVIAPSTENQDNQNKSDNQVEPGAQLPGATDTEPNRQSEESSLGINSKKPLGITLPDTPSTASDSRGIEEMISKDGLKIFVLLSNIPPGAKPRSVYYRDDDKQEQAKMIAKRLGYNSKPIPFKKLREFQGDFAEYDIIICP